MNGSSRDCDEIALRLIGGERAADDAVLASHVGSCLRCFRVSTEIRDVPRIAALLREADGEPADPGEAFWARFPETLGTAFEQRQAAPIVRAVEQTSPWRRLTGWFRLPVPAFVGGAAVAAGLALVVVHRPPPSAVKSIALQAGEPAVVAQRQGQGDEEEGALLDEDDPWERLEVADGKAIAKVAPRAESKTASDDGTELAASPAEELEMLDADDLRAVAQALRGGAI
jgi:hypothetical protein